MHRRIEPTGKPGLARGCEISVSASACIAISNERRSLSRPCYGRRKRQPVMRRAIPEAPGKTVLIPTDTYARGQASTPHKHPGSTFAYVSEGPALSRNSTVLRPRSTMPGNRGMSLRAHTTSFPAIPARPSQQSFCYSQLRGHDAIKQSLEHSREA